jgi:hypothetical protein
MTEAIYNNKKTVFFGPFVGEFGWELLFWHGWVKKLCKTRYKDYHKIACSFPGRYPFYPNVDEFMTLPDDFLKNTISSRGYITDCWINGLPKPNIEAALPDVGPLLDKVITDFKKKLPGDTEFIIPWIYRHDEGDKMYYGIKIKKSPESDKDFVSYGVPFSKQILEHLRPTLAAKETLKKIVSPEEKIIAVFPRRRLFRRPDKNWLKESYEVLIKTIREELPDFKVAVLGEPGGAFFSDGVPAGCLDLINIEKESRMDVHLAALSQAKLAIGSQSGAITFAMAAGTPVISWGDPKGEKFFAKENYTRSVFIFLPTTNPKVDLIVEYAKWIAGTDKMPKDNFARVIKIMFFRIFNPRYFFLAASKLSGIKNKLWEKRK